MIYKYLALALLTVILITASDPYFGTDLFWRPLPPESPGDVRELPWMSSDSYRPYLNDYDNRVNDKFKIAPFFKSSTQFWFLVYTQFESSHVVIHDREDLSIIYKVLDFSSLHKKGLSKNTTYILQHKLSDEKLAEFKKDFEELAKDPYSLSPRAKNIYRVLRGAGITLPIKKSDRSILFTKLKHNLRTQTGQKNFIRDGVIRFLPYQKFLESHFTNKKLPKELLAIPFLESSFNPRAHSRVNALGVWQFMPLIASYFVPKRSTLTDYRSNVGVSSVAASFLMAENYQILRSWDLAVTAYNSGTKHLVKTKRSLNVPNVDLEMVIKNSDSEHFGFASKNFFSEFLALVHVLAYRDEIYEGIHRHERKDVKELLTFYLTKCRLKLADLKNEHLIDDLLFHNDQIDSAKENLPKGFILTSKSKLPKNKFFEIPAKSLLRNKPKDWDSLVKRQSCSTR